MRQVPKSLQYASFLVRMWRQTCTNRTTENADWQCEVEHIQSGERWSFHTMNELLAFLRQQAEEGNA